ncbi:MAG: DUF4838 domain-containing protein, partial [Lentisphaerae bacterium]|nr:DUF4838 domain-containing protein [Lentisphaerota bacterium]
IWVGYQPVLKELFPQMDFDFQHPEEILIAANENHLVIAGRDRWNPDHLRVVYPRGDKAVEVNGVQLEYGTANAVYTFLQDYLDVRWFWPGVHGEDVPRRDSLAFAPFEYRYHPQIRGRAGIFVYSQLELQDGHSQDWLRFQRLQLDSLRLDTSHAFRWWERFSETHPEFFALQPDGTRGGNPPFPNARNVKMCKSNPGVWGQWLDDVAAEIERNPNKTVFSAAANDGGAQGFCTCANCRAWDPPEGPIVRFSWRGVSAEGVGLADRQLTFANTLARMLKQRFPERDDYVTMMPYGVSRPAPVAVVPDDNVIVSAVFNFHNRCMLNRGESAAEHRQMFLDWGRAGVKNLAWRPNIGSGGGWQLGMPNVAPRQAIADMRLAAENNVIAMLFDAVWEHWATQGPHYYMLAQMAWNPYADGETILEDYYMRAFGPAVSPMRDYWNMLETAAGDIVFQQKPEAEVWDTEFYRRGYEHLDRAAEALGGAPAVYGQRVAFVRAGLDYTRLYRDTAALIERLRASGGKDAEAEAAARANWEELARIFQEHPNAFDPMRIATPTAPSGLGRMRRIHPDYYQNAGK